jgi:hypothetical protein
MKISNIYSIFCIHLTQLKASPGIVIVVGIVIVIFVIAVFVIAVIASIVVVNFSGTNLNLQTYMHVLMHICCAGQHLCTHQNIDHSYEGLGPSDPFSKYFA